jgi:hypothetical protein
LVFWWSCRINIQHITTIRIDGGQTYSPAPNLWNEGTSSLCDISGSLLYYSNGTKVWNRKHQVMFNGSDLKGHPSSTAAALIIPRPRSERFAHVFTTDASENDFRNGMRHSVIDACLGNDMGDIVETEKNILLHGNMAEKLAAVQHANGIDYWVVGHEYGSNVFHVYLLTEYGVTDSLSIALGRSETIGWGWPDGIQPKWLHFSLCISFVARVHGLV